MATVQPVGCNPATARTQHLQHNWVATLTLTVLGAVGLYAIAIVSLLTAQGILSF